MLYLFHNACRNIRASKFTYLFLGLEIVLATLFIVVFLNANKSVALRNEIIEKQFDENTIMVNSYRRNSTQDKNNQNNNIPFTLNDLEYVKSELGAEVSIYLLLNTFLMGDSFENISIIFTSNLTDENKIIVGSEVYTLLNDKHYSADVFRFNAEKQVVEYHGKQYDIIRDSELDTESFTFDMGQPDIKISRCVLIPMEFLGSDNPMGNMVIYPENKISAAKTAEVINQLKTVHSNAYSYRYYNILETYHKSTLDINARVDFGGKIAYIILLQLIFGFSGLIILFIKKHEKDIAVKISLGAKKYQIILELYLEIFLFCFAGWGIGYFLGIKIINALAEITDVIHYSVHFIPFLLSVFTIFAVSILSAIPIYYKINKLEPYQILSQ